KSLNHLKRLARTNCRAGPTVLQPKGCAPAIIVWPWRGAQERGVFVFGFRLTEYETGHLDTGFVGHVRFNDLRAWCWSDYRGGFLLVAGTPAAPFAATLAGPVSARAATLHLRATGG